MWLRVGSVRGEGWLVGSRRFPHDSLLPSGREVEARAPRQSGENGSMIFREVLESIRPQDALARERRGRDLGACLSSETSVREEVTRGPDDRSAARDFSW